MSQQYTEAFIALNKPTHFALTKGRHSESPILIMSRRADGMNVSARYATEFEQANMTLFEWVEKLPIETKHRGRRRRRSA